MNGGVCGNNFIHMKTTVIGSIRVVAAVCALVLVSAASAQEPRTLMSNLALKAVRQIVLPERPGEVDPEFEGTVTVEIVVSKDGSVQSAKATTGPEVFFAASEAAARNWSFVPFLSRGAAFEARVLLAFRFLKDGRLLTDGPGGVISGPPGAVLRVDDAGAVASSASGVTVDPKAKDVKSTAEIYERYADIEMRAVHKEQPIYPSDAGRQGVQGSVLVQMSVGKDGSVKEARIVSGPRELHQAALAAARKWRFAPNPDLKVRGDVAYVGVVAFNFLRR